MQLAERMALSYRIIATPVGAGHAGESTDAAQMQVVERMALFYRRDLYATHVGVGHARDDRISSAWRSPTESSLPL